MRRYMRPCLAETPLYASTLCLSVASLDFQVHTYVSRANTENTHTWHASPTCSVVSESVGPLQLKKSNETLV